MPGRTVSLLERQDVLDVRAPPPIDRLVVIAHDEQGAPAVAQGRDERLLGRVHVLVLIDEEVAEPLHCLAVPAGPQRVVALQVVAGAGALDVLRECLALKLDLAHR